MNYLIDTNVAIALINGTPERAKRQLARVLTHKHRVAVSTISVFELESGVAHSVRRRENADRLRAFLSGPLGIVPFDEADAPIAGRLRAELAEQGRPIGPYDLLVAAQALRHGATLVTANVREFRRVSGLTVDDWA